MMLMVMSRHWQVVAADVMVMPRSCSRAIQSMMAVPSCTSPILWVRPRVVQDALSGGSFTGIDVSHDADVSHLLEWYGPCHKNLSELQRTNYHR